MADVRAAMRESAETFAGVIWPEVASICGGGRIISCEDGTSEAERHLDRLAGIDSFQVLSDETGEAMRGISSRVQHVELRGRCLGRRRVFIPTANGHSCFIGHDDDLTFTVRESRNGRPLEFHKRLHAVRGTERGFLYPHLMVHGYVAEGEFVSAAVVETKAIIEWIDDNKPELKTNGFDGTSFFVIHWREVAGIAKIICAPRHDTTQCDKTGQCVFGWSAA